MKICSKCGVEKELSEFDKKKDCKLGVRGSCKSCCKRIYSYRDRSDRNEYAKEYARKYATPERRKKWNKYNPDRVIKDGIKYRAKNIHGIILPEEIVEIKLIIIKIRRLCKTL